MTDSAALKLARAHEHLKTLKRDVERFNNLKGNHLIFDGDPYDHTRPIPIRLRVRTKPPVEKWGLLIGDCIHNARSALDHAIWDLTEQDVDIGDTQSMFPIFGTRQAFKDYGRSRLARIDSVRFHRQLALIKWLQPYRRAKPHRSALQVLHTLDIADKHKVIGVGAALLDHLRVSVEAGRLTTIQQPALHIPLIGIPRFEDGTELGTFTCSGITTSQGDPELSVTGDISIQVVFWEGIPALYRNWRVIPNLDILLSRTGEILNALGAGHSSPPKERRADPSGVVGLIRTRFIPLT